MNKLLRQRRQLLLYLGLGLSGAALGLSSRSRNEPIALPQISPEPSIALPDSGRSLPEFQGIAQWLNSSAVSIANLKGNVVLIQFWTFACINCQRTLPAIVQWHQKYEAQGLKIIGIHTPEFAFERKVDNVKQALEKHKITYPIAIDNDFKTWNAYDNEYWPHLFLGDRQGLIRYDHIGEGAYDQTERLIRQLLKEA
ncbi:thioredoxin family protein [Phormidesmis sp. 146-35]